MYVIQTHPSSSSSFDQLPIHTLSSAIKMDYVLQTGLASGMSAVSGFHSSQPSRPSEEHTGANVLPSSFCPGPRDRVTIPSAKGEIKASYISIGAWPWGDQATWHWSEDELPAVKEAWKTLYDAGINFIDTAEAYGNGRSEEIVGELVQGLPRDSFVIQTKYLGFPAAPSNLLHPIDAPKNALKVILKRLKLDYVDIYMIHGPIHPQSIASVAEGMANCVKEGLAHAIATANYGTDYMLQLVAELKKHGVPLAANQCEFSPLRRLPEINGEIKTCGDNNVIFQSYSSLAQGRLTGKYSKENPPPKSYRFSSYDMEAVEPTIQVLRQIGDKRGKSVASVSLNYNISKGALPVVGIRSKAQAEQAIDALGWRLSQEEVAAIDKVSFEGQTTRLWQQG